MPVYKLKLCYDGSRYNGWQKQGNTGTTIQETLEGALSDVFGQSVDAAGSGRTDAGVHAREQTVSFSAPAVKDLSQTLSLLREKLPGDIGALSLEEAPPRFHARLSCRGKTYVYRVWNSKEPCVFERKYVYLVKDALDMDAMGAGAAAMCGTHDFSAFTSAKRMKHSPVRTLEAISIRREGAALLLTFSGDGFLYNMVRIMAGTLLEIGLGSRGADTVPEIIESRNRQNAGFTAPARGLFLWEERY